MRRVIVAVLHACPLARQQAAQHLTIRQTQAVRGDAHSAASPLAFIATRMRWSPRLRVKT